MKITKISSVPIEKSIDSIEESHSNDVMQRLQPEWGWLPESERITSRFFRGDSLSEEELKELQNDYEKWAKKSGISASDLKTHVGQGNAIVWSPYGSQDRIVGQFIGNVFAVSHFAPKSGKSAIKALLDLLHTQTPVVFAVPENLANQLERIGFKRSDTIVPMIFHGNIMYKHLLANYSVTNEDIKDLATWWFLEAFRQGIISDEDFENMNINNSERQKSLFSNRTLGISKMSQKRFFYHGTNQGALRKIILEGLKPSGKTPVFLSNTEEYAQSYADRKGGARGILLRTYGTDVEPDLRIPEGGDFISRQTIPPEKIEVKMPNGEWLPLCLVDATIGTPERKNMKISNAIFWHGSASGDLAAARFGIHLGTYKAATEALEARIGIPAEGTWDGKRKYGETLLASKKRIEELGKHVTGFNYDAPENENYYPTGKATYSNKEIISMDSRPSINPYIIIGPMTNTIQNPHNDTKANAMMRSLKERSRARRGFYYINEGEDAGSVSAVVPDESWLKKIN